MKHLKTSILILGILVSGSMFGQTTGDSTAMDSTQAMPDSTVVGTETQGDSSLVEEDVEVIIQTKENQDSTIVRVKGMKIIVLNDDESSQPRKLIIDSDESDEDKEFDFEKKTHDPVSHGAGIRIGMNGYLNNNGLPLAAGDENLQLDYGRSISWDINLFEKDFRLVQNYVELVTGLGMHFSTYAFESQYTTMLNTPESDPLLFITDSSRTLTKNRLKGTYLTAPLMIGFATHQDEDKAFRLAFGGQASWRIGSRLKQEDVGGRKVKIRSDYDLNPFLFHAIASVGYGPLNLYANYGLNPLFKSGKTTTPLHPFDVGVQLMF
jgi:hypothetical protein